MNNYILKILEAAQLSPSADNSQPWIFKIKKDHIEIMHDLKKAYTTDLYNIDFFSDYVSLGCLLENILISANHLGYTAEIYSAKIIENKFCASILFKKTHPKKPCTLYDSIFERKTNRKFYSKKRIPPKTKEALTKLSKKRGAKLHLIEDPKQISKIAYYVGKHDIILWENKSLRINLLRMLRLKRNIEHPDGLPLDSLELGFKKHFFPLILKISEKINFLWRIVAITSVQHTQKSINRSGAIGLLTLPEDHKPSTYIKGGRIMQSIWLNITNKKIQMQPMFGSIALIINYKLKNGSLNNRHEKIRDDLSHFFYSFFPELEKETPVAFFRIGYADSPTKVSNRNEIKKVIEKN